MGLVSPPHLLIGRQLAVKITSDTTYTGRIVSELTHTH